MRKIIILGGNHNNTLGLIRSVGEVGYAVILMLQKCHLNVCYLRFSKYISKIHYLENDLEILDILQNVYWDEVEKPILLCSSDATICILDKQLLLLKEHFVIFNINSTPGEINHYMNKFNTFPIAERSGINIIKSWHISDSIQLPADIIYPCLTKPNSSLGGEKADMIICHDEQELKENLKDGIDFLVQEYIQKDFELNIIGISFNHGKEVILPAAIRKIRDEIQWQSMYMRLDSLNDYPSLNIDTIKRFVSYLGYEGLFSVELLCKDNKYYFLEVNMRNDGCGYVYTAAGANFPALWIKYNVNGFLTDAEKNTHCKTPFYVMNELDIYNVFHKKVGLFQWIKDVFRSDAFFIFCWKDLSPFFYFIWIITRNAFVRLKNHILVQK